MLESAIGLIEGVVKAHELYKGITSIIIGDKKEQYLQQIATDMKDMKVHIERLSDTILYAVNLDGVRACKEKEQQYVKDLRQIRELLEPMQRALNQPLLTSALISAPMPALSHPRLRLKDISTLKMPIIPVVDYPWVPVLFEDDDASWGGKYWIGWQTPEYLSQELGCEYQKHWQPNQNVMPFRYPVDIFSTGVHQPKSHPVDTTDIYTNSIGMKFQLIKAGKFQMGSEKGRDNEKPVHTVEITKDFYMGIYQTTVGQYKKYADEKGGYFDPDYNQQGDNAAVTCVSWEDAQKFISWLNEKEGGEHYRLPTEAEWEYAARAGTTTEYSFGDDESLLGDYAWYGKNSGGHVHIVGQKKPNPYGLYDMHGNVWEWCADSWHENYKGAPTDGQVWNGGDESRRVLRGVSWNNNPRGARTAIRVWGPSVGRVVNFGFRVVSSVAWAL
jgi:formylglycine-generating enzyme required for sulfatase activity